ncbi:hypothetical protein BD560DRAFT_434327 [Blakeslea trispora]|nr:hypothetical protein BD560DRAFT_434327 [Blakeslea trispora]
MGAEAVNLEHHKLKNIKSGVIPGRYIVKLKKGTKKKFDHKLFNAASIDLGHSGIEVLKHILKLSDVKAA